MNATTTQARKTRKPAAKTERSVTLLQGSVQGGRLLRIATRKEGERLWAATYYLLHRAGPMSWTVQKIDGTAYRIQLGKDAAYSNCSCPGHEHRSTCKHVDALLALRSNGKLDPAAASLEDF